MSTCIQELACRKPLAVPALRVVLRAHEQRDPPETHRLCGGQLGAEDLPCLRHVQPVQVQRRRNLCDRRRSRKDASVKMSLLHIYIAAGQPPRTYGCMVHAGRRPARVPLAEQRRRRLSVRLEHLLLDCAGLVAQGLRRQRSGGCWPCTGRLSVDVAPMHTKPRTFAAAPSPCL